MVKICTWSIANIYTNGQQSTHIFRSIFLRILCHTTCTFIHKASSYECIYYYWDDHIHKSGDGAASNAWFAVTKTKHKMCKFPITQQYLLCTTPEGLNNNDKHLHFFLCHTLGRFQRNFRLSPQFILSPAQHRHCSTDVFLVFVKCQQCSVWIEQTEDLETMLKQSKVKCNRDIEMSMFHIHLKVDTHSRHTNTQIYEKINKSLKCHFMDNF